VAIIAMMLGGCAGRSGADFVTVAQQLGPPKSGRSRIVLLAERRMGLAAAVCDVEIDGSPVGKLKPETYVYTDRPVGRQPSRGNPIAFSRRYQARHRHRIRAHPTFSW